jgi:hypothetical protein
MKSHLETVVKHIDRTAEILREIKTVKEIRNELMRELAKKIE